VSKTQAASCWRRLDAARRVDELRVCAVARRERAATWRERTKRWAQGAGGIHHATDITSAQTEAGGYF
jgi:hypothetical protein